MDYIALGQNIKMFRKKIGITQEQFAEICNITPVFVSQIENAMRKPSLETIYSMAKALNVTIDELINENVGTIQNPDSILKILQNRSVEELEFSFRILSTVLENLDNGKISIS